VTISQKKEVFNRVKKSNEWYLFTHIWFGAYG